MDREVRGNRYCGSHVVELYNVGRPHVSLGPGIPDSSAITTVPAPSSRHRHAESYAVRANRILGGLHHEYFLVPAAE